MTLAQSLAVQHRRSGRYELFVRDWLELGGYVAMLVGRRSDAGDQGDILYFCESEPRRRVMDVKEAHAWKDGTRKFPFPGGPFLTGVDQMHYDWDYCVVARDMRGLGVLRDPEPGAARVARTLNKQTNREQDTIQYPAHHFAWFLGVA